jgi:hypothetical protein
MYPLWHLHCPRALCFIVTGIFGPCPCSNLEIVHHALHHVCCTTCCVLCNFRGLNVDLALSWP